MKAFQLLGLVLTLTSCAVPTEDEGTESVEQAATSKCPPRVCGLNAGELTNGGFFHSLNLDGLVNDEGYSLVSTSKNGSYYKLAVTNGKISASMTMGIVGAPTYLSGSNLAGTKLRLKKVTANGTFYYNITISSVANTTDYWAKRTNGLPTPKIETYKLWFQGESSQIGAFLCQNGAEFVDPSSPVRAMPEHHALVFEGDLIDVATLSVTGSNPRWFNIGCAETALAKMQLNGHTYAAQPAGFSNTQSERQTFLKMITADYCGIGNSFTVSGQKLRWSDDDGTMTIAWYITKELEAHWGPNGATCLNTPRVIAHPTDASEAAFENGVWMEIDHWCQRPPPCSSSGIQAIPHLKSWNPTPFTTN
ncbi:MAG: ADYC domain-containing protein [Myxococcota bacterium]|nr:hypothetical protein [Deltaproteobacteria bacterium]MDQ3333685.1 ADYC domain-containing protein [Myxococcota bacterium]